MSTLTPTLLFMTASLTLTAAPVWQDEFDQPIGSAPDATQWSYDLGDNGWGNAEKQNYTNSRENSFIADDPAATDGRALVIRAVQTPAGGYTSARLKTAGKYTVAYGRIEARIRIPLGQGVWPAFWMLGASIGEVGWPQCGEIDILEALGHTPHKAHGTLHGPGYSGQHGISKAITLPGDVSLADDYHVYAVEWSPGRIEWFLDGISYHVLTPAALPQGTKWVFDDAPHFLILNVAVGGYWPGYPDETTKFPQEMRVDYVRVYALQK